MSSLVSDIFDVRYGHSLELNALEQTSAEVGVAFVSRQMGYNGISAYIEPIKDVEPADAGEITVALSGNGVLTTYIQEAKFYTGFHVAILRPKVELTKHQALFYCHCIKANRFRFSYGRQANKTLAILAVPSVLEIPNWVDAIDLNQIDGANSSLFASEAPKIETSVWLDFRYDSLFDIKKGQRLTKSKMVEGSTPFIGSIDSKNGHRQYINVAPNHKANTITVNYNGSVAEAFYQPNGFWASDDVNVLYPKFEMTQFVGMFLCTLIRQEKFRFNYGRKWHLGRMNESIIKLPTKVDGQPDFDFMENYVKSLPYSKSI
jgi:hypothetical protein